MSKLIAALDIIRTIVTTLILFIMIGVIVFIYIERDAIGKIITNVTDNINSVGQAAISINTLTTKVNVWIDKGDILATTESAINNAKMLLERNKDVNITTIIDNLNTIIAILQNISEILLLSP
jgi:hypothetical protein